MTANKNKLTTAIVAGAAAVALLLGGTFAWTNLNQRVKNVAVVDINPGGRLHDDFNGTNKDVYVENFGNSTTGVPIYARIRLDEYMEIGQDAGINKSGENRKVKILDLDEEDEKTPNINDTSTWQTYIPGNSSPAHDYASKPTVYNEYWSWELGQDDENKLPYYLPTFNMNKDSLAADINGTYEGNVAGDIVHYDDYIEYAENEPIQGVEIHDWDSDTQAEPESAPYDNGGITESEECPIDTADVLHKSTVTDAEGNVIPLSHTTRKITKTSSVILMSDYIALSAEERKDTQAWVYDIDGWAYWSQAIQPGETTGLLLDGIEMETVPHDNWYYGINAVGQFATVGDISAFEADGLTDNALELLSDAAGALQSFVISGAASIPTGSSATYTAETKRLGITLDGQPESIQWSITELSDPTLPADAITVENGTVKVAEGVAEGTSFTLNASTDTLTASWQITVASPYETLSLNPDKELVLPLFAGETNTYKLNFPTEDENGEKIPADSYQLVSKELYNPILEYGGTFDYDEDFENSEDSAYSIKWEDGNAEVSYDPATQLLTVTQNSKNIFIEQENGEQEGNGTEALESIPIIFGARFAFKAGENAESCNVRFSIPFDYPAMVTLDPNEPMMAFLQIPFYEYMQPIFVRYDIENSDSSADLFDSSTWTEYLVDDIGDLRLMGTYNNGISYDEEKNLLYIPAYNRAPFILMATHYPEGQEPYDILGIGLSFSSMDLTGTLLKAENFVQSGELYTATVLEDSLYLIEDSAIPLAKFEAAGELPDGFVLSGVTIPIPDSAENDARNLHWLYIPQGFADAEDPTVTLIVSDSQRGEYRIKLTVIKEAIDAESVKISSTDLTLSENGEATITAAGTYTFAVNYDAVLGAAEQTVKWTCVSENGSGVTVNESTGAVNVENGAYGTWTLTPKITSGKYEFDSASAVLTIEIPAE